MKKKWTGQILNHSVGICPCGHSLDVRTSPPAEAVRLNYTVCAANRHDSKETARVLTEPPKGAHGEPVWLDAGYAGMEDMVRAKHMTPIICEKGTRGHPLTDEQKERNRQKSKVRSRVEHVFGFMEQTMGGLVFRGVEMVRAKANIAKVECRASLLDMPRCSNVTKGNIAKVECRASLLDMPRCSNVTKGNIALTNLVYCYGLRPKWSEHVPTSANQEIPT